MTHKITRSLAPLSMAVVGVASALLVSAPAASADPFCGGATVNYNNACYGASRSMSGDNAYGDNTSVCVGVDGNTPVCSSGPGQIASYNLGSTGVHSPEVIGNAANYSVAHGNTF